MLFQSLYQSCVWKLSLHKFAARYVVCLKLRHMPVALWIVVHRVDRYLPGKRLCGQLRISEERDREYDQISFSRGFHWRSCSWDGRFVVKRRTHSTRLTAKLKFVAGRSPEPDAPASC
jgi:hypothetical protein